MRVRAHRVLALWCWLGDVDVYGEGMGSRAMARVRVRLLVNCIQKIGLRMVFLSRSLQIGLEKDVGFSIGMVIMRA